MQAQGNSGYFGLDLSGRGPVLRTVQWLVSLAVGLAAAWAGAYNLADWLLPMLGRTPCQVTGPALGILTACLAVLLLAPRYRWSLVPTLVVLCLLYLIGLPVLYGGVATPTQAAHWGAVMTGGVLGALLGLFLAALAKPSALVRSTGARIGVGWLSMVALCVLVGALRGGARARSFDETRADLSERILPAVEQWLGSYVLTIKPEVRWRTPTDDELEGAGPRRGTDGKMVRPRGNIRVMIHGEPRRVSKAPEPALATGVEVSVSLILALPEAISEVGITTKVLESAGLRPELAREFEATPGRRGTFVAEQKGVRVSAYPVQSDSLSIRSNYWDPGWEWLRLDCVNFSTSYIRGP